MAKATRAVGPSLTEDEKRDPSPPTAAKQPVRIRRAELGYVDQKQHDPPDPEEVPKSVGINSSTSTGPNRQRGRSATVSPRKPARTTENPSEAPERETVSDVRSTGGDGQTTTTQQSDEFDEFFD